MMDALDRLRQRLMYMVSRARLSLVDDSAAVQRVQADFGGGWVQDKLPRMAQYGFQSVPPADTDAVVLFMGGNAADGVVIATGSRTYRLRGLAEGEVAISDNRGQKVYLSAAGIRIEGGSLPIQIDTSGDLTINATTLRVNGDTVFTGQVRANGHRIDETHKHSGVQAGGSLTGVVT